MARIKTTYVIEIDNPEQTHLVGERAFFTRVSPARNKVECTGSIDAAMHYKSADISPESTAHNDYLLLKRRKLHPLFKMHSQPVPTRGQLESEWLGTVMSEANERMVAWDALRRKFALNVNEDPSGAIAWLGADVMVEQIVNEYFTDLTTDMTDKTNEECVILFRHRVKSMTQRIVVEQRVEQSSGVFSNIADRARNTARAQFIERVNWWIEFWDSVQETVESNNKLYGPE